MVRLRDVRLFAWTVVLAGVVAGSHLVTAHEVPYAGIVVRIEREAVHVRIAATDDAPETTMRFAVVEETRVRRGDKVVAWANADIAREERIVVIVDHDAETPNVAVEIRLAAR